MPEEEPIVPTDKVLLLHEPPIVASLNVVDVPAQIGDAPVMPAGTGLTVTITSNVVAGQPLLGS